MRQEEHAIHEASRLIRGARYLTAFLARASPSKAVSRPSEAPKASRAATIPGSWSWTTSWPILREIFYAHFGKARPNRAHEVLAAWEARGLLKVLITQNIDSVQWN